MDPAFWQAKWQHQDTGFHQDTVNAALSHHWPTLAQAPNSRVLLPLCGKTQDLIWLRAQGHRVVGIELSEIALDALAEALHQQLGLVLNKQAQGALWLYHGDGVLLIAGDFFAITPEQLGTVDAIYDRAALVALPEAMRQDYCQHLQQLAPQASQLLVTLDYDPQRRDGPPFAVSDAEVRQHYSQAYAIRQLEQCERIDEELKFKAQGLDSLIQRVYQLQPR